MNGPKAVHARTVKSVIAAFFNGQDVSSDEIKAFRKAARALDGAVIVQERLTGDLQPTDDKSEIVIEGLARSVTALITAHDLQKLTLP